MGLLIATKSFFKLLFNRDLSQQFQQLLDGQLAPKIEAQPLRPAPVERPQPKPSRSDAITLLAALQREARLLDIVKEPLDGYSDAQIGAAARDVLKNSAAVIERMFALEPLTDAEDGTPLSTPSDFDPSEYRLTGKVAGSGPFSGTVAHHGWKATRCDVPQWSGKTETALIVAPVELEVG